MPVTLLSSSLAAGLPAAERLLRTLDQRLVLPLWRRCGADRVAAARAVDLLSTRVDLLHHTYGLILPLHRRTNVMTVPDLIPRHFPELCPAETIALMEEAFAHVDRMDAILTFSEHTKSDLVESLGVRPDRIHVVPLAAHPQYRPLPPGERQQVLAAYDLVARPYVLYLGSLDPRKNVRSLIEAFHHIRHQADAREHQLVLAGPKGWMAEPVFELIDRLGLQSAVRWLDHVPFEHLPALLGGAHLFVYPSLYEGFGLPPLEAMACGTPVVASRATSLPEVVGDAGLLVDATRPTDLADAMRRVIADRALHAALSAKGQRRAAVFSWGAAAQMTLGAYAAARAATASSVHAGADRDGAQPARDVARQWVVGRINYAALHPLR